MDQGVIPVITTFFDSFEVIKSEAESWLTIGRTIACIGAYVYIFKKFGSKIISGEVFNIQDIGYPVFIAFLLSVYSPVAKGIEEIFTSTYDSKYIAENVNGIYKLVAAKKEEKESTITEDEKTKATAASEIPTDIRETAEEYLGKEDEKETRWMSTVVDTLKSGYNAVVNGINDMILSGMIWLLEGASIACIAVIFILAKVYIAFLYMFGPLSIGMSLVPGFENSITNWFQKYIGYALWMPIAGTVTSLTQNVLTKSFNMTSESNVTGVVDLFEASMILLISVVLLIVLILAVPKIASNIISTSVGSSSTGSKIMTIIQMSQGVGSKGGGSGGMGGVVSGVAGTVASGGVTAAVQAGAAVISAANNASSPAKPPQRP